MMPRTRRETTTSVAPVVDSSGPAAVRQGVHPSVARLAAYSWRLIVIGVVALAALWLVGRLRVAVAAILIAVLLTRALSPISSWLRRHRWPRGLAAATALLVFLLVLVGLAAAIAPSIADEAGSLGPTVTRAVDDIEDWLVDDSPVNVDRVTIDRLRERAAEGIEDLFRVSGGTVIDGAVAAAEVIAVLFLSVLLTFFMLRDGGRFVSWVFRRVRPGRRQHLQKAAERGWSTLGGYLRGVVVLGAVESVFIGLTLLLAGGGLVVPVMIVTFVGAFVPIVGAIAAGVIAVLVALVTGGPGTAITVAVVAVVVQQLDGDLLAPVIYGRALNLHPVVVLLSVTAGGALFGFAGTVLAVPVAAVTVNVGRELRSHGASQVGPSTDDVPSPD